MKKIYIKPETETVNVRLNSSVLTDPGMGGWSDGTEELGAKENNLFFDDDAWDNDLWGDSDNATDSYDTWKE